MMFQIGYRKVRIKLQNSVHPASIYQLTYILAFINIINVMANPFINCLLSQGGEGGNLNQQIVKSLK